MKIIHWKKIINTIGRRFNLWVKCFVLELYSFSFLNNINVSLLGKGLNQSFIWPKLIFNQSLVKLNQTILKPFDLFTQRLDYFVSFIELWWVIRIYFLRFLDDICFYKVFADLGRNKLIIMLKMPYPNTVSLRCNEVLQINRADGVQLEVINQGLSMP